MNDTIRPSIENRFMEYIAQTVSKCINETKNSNELSESLQVENISQSTISGHTDCYYPTFNFQDLVEISKIKRVPIPPELIEQFKNIQYTCFMGLFTSISRAWLSIDNLIFFWNYEDGSDICFYDSLNDAILAVDLFKPKKDSFPEGVDYALCIATSNSVILLSIEFLKYTKGNGEIVNEMRFSSQPFYTISTDNVIINTIKSSLNGRIFMGAKDGCLYEFFYQAQTGWFSSQTKKINLSHSKLFYFVPSFLNFNEVDSIVQIELDESRNILYTRSENNSIQVFYLGSNGMDTHKVSAMSASTIVNRAAVILNTNDKHIFQPIVHIAALDKLDSNNINLVAMTHYGIRLYFSLNPFDRTNDPPSTFQLVHVRLAPNIDLNSHSNMGPIISAFYKNGLTVMMNKRDEQMDSVLLLSNDLYILHNQYKESKAIFDIDGRIWQIDEIPNRERITDDDSCKLSSQLFDSQRRFAMITPQGCFIWNKLRPIDQFYFALIESNGPNSDLVRLFFNKIYSRSEACALSLAVALVRLSTDIRVTDWATKAFFVYGGDAEIRKRSALSSLQNLGSQQPQTQVQTPVDANETLIGNRLYPQLPQSEIKPNINRANFSFSQLHSPKVASTPMHHRTKDYSSASAIASPGPKSFISSSIQQQQPYMTASSVLQPSDINSEFELILSGKHDALYIYLSRLLAPIWNKRLLYEIQAGSDGITFASFTQIDIDFYLTKLNALKSFLEYNYTFLQPQNLQNYLYQSDKLMNELFGGSANLGTILLQWNTNKLINQMRTSYTSMPINATTLINTVNQLSKTTSFVSSGGSINYEKIAQEIENQLIVYFKRFLDHLIEVSSLWKILHEHKYHFLANKLDRQTQIDLLNYEICNYLFADQAIYEQLITALLYRYIDDNASTDLLNKNLKQACPSLFTNENAIYSKACEKLKQSVSLKTLNEDERQMCINEAVNLMKQIGYVDNLLQICETLNSCKCYNELFDLCLSAAEKRDPQQIALYYYRNNEPMDDKQGSHFYETRNECYKCMFNCLTQLVRNCTSLTTDSIQVPQQKLLEQIYELIEKVTKSNDELAHVALFNWMIENRMKEKLFKLNSPYLESFLKRKVMMSTKNRSYLDLLWLYYDNKKDYLMAAKVLASLAETQNDSEVTLKERIDYLTRAIVALNSSLKTSYKEEETELKDKLDVALIQEKIYQQINRQEPKNELMIDALKQLNSQLFDITKLFIDFADKFELYECQLLIFKVSRHEDSSAIEYAWKQIIANELDKVLTMYPSNKNEQKRSLANSIVSIAEQYVDGNEKYFPLGLLIDSLEFMAFSRDLGIDWTPRLLRQLNIPFAKLFKFYDQLYQTKNIKWEGNNSHLVGSIYSLIELFTSAPNTTTPHDKLESLRLFKDNALKYLNELQRINDELANDLIGKFKTLLHVLDRM